MAAILMTHLRAAASARVVAAFTLRTVTEIAAHTVGHIAYLAPSRAGEPMACHGDTLAPARTWKNEFR
jgi:hypothetical protein